MECLSVRSLLVPFLLSLPPNRLSGSPVPPDFEEEQGSRQQSAEHAAALLTLPGFIYKMAASMVLVSADPATECW